MPIVPFCIILSLMLPFFSLSQSIDHWEAAVLAEEEWRYRIGNSEPPSDWNQSDFDDSSWNTGFGGFGYSDGDDNTLLPTTLSVYLRKEFEITDTALISAVTLYADYDDAFVAYLNGVEIARANIGTPGVAPAHNETSYTDHEAQLYQGGLPELFTISPQQLADLWTNGTNTLSVQVHNVGIGSSDMSALFFLMVGISDDSNDYQEVPAWFPEPFVSSDLPLLLINTYGIPIPDEPKIDAHLGIIDNGPGVLNFLTDDYNGYDGSIAIEIRGSSSQSFAKKNYSFETRLENGENNNVPLLGMPEENDWVLHGPYSDKSLMRNVLSYHIGNQMDQYAPRTRWCEVLINNEYKGLYVLVEKIKRDDNRVDIARLTPNDVSGDELTGGYIFSVDRDDDGPQSGWYSPFTDFLFYKYQDPDFDELQPEQKDYLQTYVTIYEEAMQILPTAETYEHFIDVPSWIDYWIATEIFKHVDNFKFSFYMYKRKESNGGKIYFGPLWDINLGYGNFDFAKDPGPQGWSYEWVNSGVLRPFWVLDLSEDPEIQNKVHCRWQELRQGALHTDSLLSFIDSTAAYIENAQIRNFERWPVLGTYVWPNAYVGDTYEEEVSFLKDWLVERLQWMDDNMFGDCSLVAGEKEPNPFRVNVYPNPFQNELNVQLRGNYPGKAQLRLLDARGHLVAEEDLTSQQTAQVFSLSSLGAGLYFYQINIEDRVIASGKLVKQ
ncbi:MAG: T9SS type A sorting domain-containing protein [Bacteroidetes bacterium]|nr:T9SS type A sorting domain-containing protein [Bacteroidota bacterium]